MTISDDGDAVARIQADLIAEHLGADRAAVAEIAADGLIATIEAMRGPGRSLVPYEIPTSAASRNGWRTTRCSIPRRRRRCSRGREARSASPVEKAALSECGRRHGEVFAFRACSAHPSAQKGEVTA
ncbi:hypothetical protein AB5I41_01090 [Sphingomonas sp. MMS24-JH45]